MQFINSFKTFLSHYYKFPSSLESIKISYWTYKNNNKPEQIWVSCITYTTKREILYYLSLITDAYSKKIVGYNI